MEALRNWAGNHTYQAADIRYPTTVAEVQEVVRGAERVKALGSRHSFSAVADTTGTLLSLEKLNGVVALDRERRSVTVEGGITYGQLCPFLHREGYALHNTASLPHITVAGACSTSTHGSGDENGGLATAVSALELVMADGSLVTFSRDQDPDRFQGAVVSLGGLGVVIRLTLKIEPTFTVTQTVYERFPLSRLEECFEALMASGYSVSLFTNWMDGVIDQVWVKRRVVEGDSPDSEPELFGAPCATETLHPIRAISPESCTGQLGVPGPWHERLPHFRIDHTPSAGDELQSEYFVPRRHAIAALQAVAGLGAEIAPLVQISEVRTIAADSLWMSHFYQRDSIAIHFTWHPNWPAVRNLLPRLEERLEPFEARPHWGKLSTMSPARLQSLYERLPDFRQLLWLFDPGGKFRNSFLSKNLLETP